MKKHRIGIVGTENSHAHVFSKLFNIPDEKGDFKYPDCHVTLVYGNYPDENKRVVNEFKADAVAENIDEMKKNVDAVMITARDGKYHYEFAKPFIEAGIPTFVDKPFTVKPDEAEKLIQSAKENSVPLCGGSSLKYAYDVLMLKNAVHKLGDNMKSGFVSAPLNMVNDYSGFCFYSSHLAEICLTVFGSNPKSVVAVQNNNSVYAIVNYDRFSVTNNFNDMCFTSYSGSVFGTDKTYHREIDLSLCGILECDAFVNMLRTGIMPYTYEELTAPVFFLNAVEESYETGKEVAIKDNQ